jgi:hypothetical protein
VTIFATLTELINSKRKARVTLTGERSTILFTVSSKPAANFKQQQHGHLPLWIWVS